MRIIITGGPCTGKSTILDQIKTYRGIHGPIVPEVARGVFERLKLYEPEKIEDRDFTQRLIESIQIKNWHENPKGIFDRGLPDEFAYRLFHNMGGRTTLWNKCWGPIRYDKVFFLPYWPEIYATDDIRKETPEEAERLEMLIHQSYFACGYTPIEVPIGPVEERVNFILNNI